MAHYPERFSSKRFQDILEAYVSSTSSDPDVAFPHWVQKATVQLCRYATIDDPKSIAFVAVQVAGSFMRAEAAGTRDATSGDWTKLTSGLSGETPPELTRFFEETFATVGVPHWAQFAAARICVVRGIKNRPTIVSYASNLWMRYLDAAEEDEVWKTDGSWTYKY